MGTSTSSSGPRSGASFDPPWLNDIDGSAPAALPDAAIAPAAAPARRFAGARRDFNSFISGAGALSIGRAIGQYSRTGMGGASRAAARMRPSTNAAAGLASFLGAVRDRATPEISNWVDALVATSPSPDQIADAIVRELALSGGSADEESLRNSMARAFIDLLTIQPSLDLLAMADSDIWLLLQLFLSNEVCNRLQFDVAQFFESSRIDPLTAVTRETEMRDFVKNGVALQLSKLAETTKNPTRQQLEALMQDALRAVFETYEGCL